MGGPAEVTRSDGVVGRISVLNNVCGVHTDAPERLIEPILGERAADGAQIECHTGTVA